MNVLRKTVHEELFVLFLLLVASAVTVFPTSQELSYFGHLLAFWGLPCALSTQER